METMLVAICYELTQKLFQLNIMGNVTETESTETDKETATTNPESPTTKIIPTESSSPKDDDADEARDEAQETSPATTSTSNFNYSDLEILDDDHEFDDADDQSQPPPNHPKEGHTSPNTSNETDITDHDDEEEEGESDIDTTPEPLQEGSPTESPPITHPDTDYDFESIFRFDFDGKDEKSNINSIRNLSKIKHKKSYSYYKFEEYGNLLSNILLNAFMNDIENDENRKSIELMSYNICSIIIDFLEIYTPKSLCMEHNSYYCIYAMNDIMDGNINKNKNNIKKIRSIIGRLPMRNNYYRSLSNIIKPFIYIGNDAITFCAKYYNKNNTKKGVKHICNKRKHYESLITFPVKYNIPIFTNNNNKNVNVENDLKQIWKYIVNVDIGINIKNHPILMLMSSQIDILVKEALMKFAFETMHVPAMCIMDKNALILSLINGLNNDNDNGNGLIIEISNDVTTITPIIDYKICQNEMKISTFHSGTNLFKFLSSVLNAFCF